MRIAPLPETELAFLRRYARTKAYHSGEVLLEVGEEPGKCWFLAEGFLRFFYITDEGREYNKAFSRPGEIVVPLTGLRTRQPSAFAIAAVTAAATVILPLSIIPRLYERHSAWERIGPVLAEDMAMRKEARKRDFLLDPALVRYRRFAKRYPELVDLLPQRQIANYIGVTEQALSRILRTQRDDQSSLNPG